MKTKQRNLNEVADHLGEQIEKLQNLITKDEPKKNETFENFINFMYND